MITALQQDERERVLSGVQDDVQPVIGCPPLRIASGVMATHRDPPST